jgi:hypothetical protein
MDYFYQIFYNNYFAQNLCLKCVLDYLSRALNNNVIASEYFNVSYPDAPLATVFDYISGDHHTDQNKERTSLNPD